GLPVYLIRDDNLTPPLLVPPIMPAGLVSLEDSLPTHPVIYKTLGTEADVKKKLDEIHNYSRIWMYFDPESSSRFHDLELDPNGSHIITLQHLISSRNI